MKSVIYASNGYRKFFNRSIEKFHFLVGLNINSLSDCTIVIDLDHKFGVFDSGTWVAIQWQVFVFFAPFPEVGYQPYYFVGC